VLINNYISGNHETLMDARGNYHGLVEAQNLRVKGDDQKEADDDDEPSSVMISIL
jgi:hypothetical protein